MAADTAQVRGEIADANPFEPSVNARKTLHDTAQFVVMDVELDIFSGRPNPTWRLTEGESAAFLEKLTGLNPTDEGKIRDGLGYRGLVVTSPGETVAGFESIVCSGGLVLGRRREASQRFVDENRNLERWLFRTGKGHVSEELRLELARELDVAE